MPISCQGESGRGKAEISNREINGPGTQRCRRRCSRVVMATGVRKRRRRRRAAGGSIGLRCLIWLPSTCSYGGGENQRAARGADRAADSMPGSGPIDSLLELTPSLPAESTAETEGCSLATELQLHFIGRCVHLVDLFVCSRSLPQSAFSLDLSKESTAGAEPAPPSSFSVTVPLLSFLWSCWFANCTLAEISTGEAGNKDIFS